MYRNTHYFSYTRIPSWIPTCSVIVHTNHAPCMLLYASSCCTLLDLLYSVSIWYGTFRDATVYTALEKVILELCFQKRQRVWFSCVRNGEWVYNYRRLQCVGNESKLSDCPSRQWLTHNCGHGEDAGVDCSKGIIYSATNFHVADIIGQLSMEIVHFI